MKIFFFFLTIISLLFPQTSQAEVTLKLHKIITLNTEQTNFKVNALAIDDSYFYIAEDNNIHKFNYSGKLIQSFEKVLSPTLNISNPSSINIDKTMNIYITDTEQNKIFIFNTFGKLIKAFGQFGYKPNSFNEPADLALSNQFQIFVLDQLNHRIQKFDKNLNLITVFGSYGTGKKSLFFPQSMCINKQNELLVIDKTKSIKFFDIFGNYLGCIDTSLNKKDKHQIKTDTKNNIYLLNLSNPEIHIYNSQGKLIYYSALNLKTPLKMYINDHIYIAESSPLKIHIYNLLQ